MKKNEVFINPRIIIAICIYVMIITIICLGIIFGLETDLLVAETETDKLIIEIIFIVLILLLNISVLKILIPKWFVKIKFSDNGLYVLKPFQRAFLIPYSNIRQITIATYNHIGILSKYIVFSTRKLSDYEKTHVNLINDKNVIILRHGKKVLRLIEEFGVKTGDGSVS